MVDVALLERRPLPKPAPIEMDHEAVATYRDICASIGLVNPEITIEDFKFFLNGADLPVFALDAVSSYMDELTATDNPSRMGWEWRPVRAADRLEYRFGRPATDDRSMARTIAWQDLADAMMMDSRARGFFSGRSRPSPMPKIEVAASAFTPASDYYAGSTAKVYDRAIPVHALKKIARIEKEFGAGRVAFMITDYVTQPHVVINPDPFLMAVVPNKELAKGVGRFIIDVWDEPGFGIAQMLGA